jgi:hypothetical protein
MTFGNTHRERENGNGYQALMPSIKKVDTEKKKLRAQVIYQVLALAPCPGLALTASYGSSVGRQRPI